jgi:hypothetical protein
MAAESTYTLIQTITLSTNAGITFSNVPQTYTDLVVVGQLRGLYAASLEVALIQWGYTQTYSYTAMRSNGSTADSYGGSSAYGLYCNSIPGASTASGIFGTFEAHIFNYTNTTTFKQCIVKQSYDYGSSGGGTSVTCGTRNLTGAITSVEIGGGNNAIVAGSTVSLYGIKAA